jgi:hypothetical protein
VSKRTLAQDEDDLPPPPPTGHLRGARVHSTHLNDDDVRKIRKLHAAGWTISALAKEYKVLWLTMSRIVKGLSWKHVTMDVPGAKDAKLAKGVKTARKSTK